MDTYAHHLPDALLDTLQDATEAHFDPMEYDA